MPSGVYKRKPLTQEQKDKMKGKPFANGKFTWLGKKRSDESKQKMSESHKKNVLEGKCHLYKDGRCSDNGYVSWISNKRNRLKLEVSRELGSHTYGEWELLKKQYNYTCPCCKLSEPFIGQKSEALTEDHIIPLSKGGSDLIENIQPLCLSCNLKKHTLIIKY